MKNKIQVIIILLGIMILFAGKSHAFSVQEGNIYRGCDNDTPNWLMHGWSLYHDSCLVSPNGLYMAIFQGNGSLTTFRFHGVKPTNKDKVTFNMDGYFGKDSKTIWSSGNRKGHPGQRLILQNDGNLVIYDRQDLNHGKKVSWSSGTQHSGANLLTLNDKGQLILSRVKQRESEYGPKIIGWKGHRRYRQKGSGALWVGGKKSNYTPSGIFIVDVDMDAHQKKRTIFSPSGASANLNVHNCTKNGTPAEGSQHLTATVENSETWGTSKTTGYSATIGIEIGNDAIGKLKEEFTVNKSFTVDHNKTTTITNSFDLIANYKVLSGQKQKIHMLIYKMKNTIPYTGYQYLTIEGIQFLSRNKINDEMELNNSYGAYVSYKQAKSCNL